MMSELDHEFVEAAQDLQEEIDDYKYIAFISYRHIQPDAAIAAKIHTLIETFKLPKEFLVDGKKPNFRVFRDREELTTTSLNDSLDVALRSSKFLIVICSKRLPLSQWCTKEVETFVALRGINRVIPVLIEGEPHESFPVILRDKEILGAELRPLEVQNPSFVDYKELEKNNPSKLKELTDQSIKLLNTEKYRIMAAILGVTYGDLKQRDKERRQRTIMISSLVAATLLLFFGIFMFNAYRNENIAKIQTIQDKSRMQLQRAQELINNGDRLKAVYLSNEAMNVLDPSMNAYDELRDLHTNILNDSVNLFSSSFLTSIKTQNMYSFVDINADGDKFVVGLDNDGVGIFDLRKGQLLQKVVGHTQQVKLVDYSSDNKYFVSGGFDDVINVWDGVTYENLAQIKTPGNVMLLNFSANNQYFNVIYDTIENYYFQRYDLDLNEVGDPIKLNRGVFRVVFTSDDKRMIINYDTFREDQSLIIYDLEKSIAIKNLPDQMKEAFSFNEDEEPTIEKIRYEDVKMSKDDRYVYSKIGGSIAKIDIETDKAVYTLEESTFGKMMLFESIDGNFFYYINGGKLVKHDATTGKKLLEIQIGKYDIEDARMSKDGSTVVVLSSTSEVTVIKDERIIGVTQSSGFSPEYIYVNDDGSLGLALSLRNQMLKIFETQPVTNETVVDAQIVDVSSNNLFTLFYNNGQLMIYDNTTKEKVRDINYELLDFDYAFFNTDTGIQLSNNGLYLTFYEEIEKAGSPVLRLFVLDTESNTEVLSVETNRLYFDFDISPNGDYLFYESDVNTIEFKSVFKDKPDASVVIDTGYVRKFFMDESAQYLIVVYEEGNSFVYDILANRKVGEVVGEIVYLHENEKVIEIVSVYNNIGSKYEDFEKVSDVTLSPIRDEKGTTYNDTNLYDATNDRLLTLKSFDDKFHNLYLIDFNTGRLIQSIELYNSSFNPKAVFVNEGNELLFDKMFTSTYSEFGESIFDFSGQDYSYHASYYPIDKYNSLLEESNKLIDGITLTQDELVELGLQENK